MIIKNGKPYTSKNTEIKVGASAAEIPGRTVRPVKRKDCNTHQHFYFCVKLYSKTHSAKSSHNRINHALCAWHPASKTFLSLLSLLDNVNFSVTVYSGLIAFKITAVHYSSWFI